MLSPCTHRATKKKEVKTIVPYCPKEIKKGSLLKRTTGVTAQTMAERWAARAELLRKKETTDLGSKPFDRFKDKNPKGGLEGDTIRTTPTRRAGPVGGARHYPKDSQQKS